MIQVHGTKASTTLIAHAEIGSEKPVNAPAPVYGIYPAMRTARMGPVELRHE